MRSRQGVRSQDDEGHGSDPDRRQGRKLFAQKPRQEDEGERDCGRREDRHAAPASEGVSAGVEDLRQPFLGNPMHPIHAEGERVGGGEGTMRDDPAADDEVPIAVGIIEEAVPGEKDHAIENDAGREGNECRRGEDPALSDEGGLGHAIPFEARQSLAKNI